MEGRRLLLALLLAAVSFSFAFAALVSPVKSIPANTTTSPKIGFEYDSAVYADLLPLWYFQSYAELAEAFAVTAVLSLLLPRALSRPSPAKGRTRRALKVAGYVLAACGGIAWAAIALSSWLDPNPRYVGDYTLGSPTYLLRETGNLVVYSGPSSLAQLSTLLLGTLGVVLVGLDRGGRRALVDSILFYAAPLSLFYEAGLDHFLPLAMTDHVMSSLKLYEGGIQPLSNWLVLVVAAFLTSMGLWDSRARLSGLLRRRQVQVKPALSAMAGAARRGPSEDGRAASP